MERPTGSALHANCPSRQVLDLIANKWTAMILYLLSLKTQRYSELLHGIEGISKKMLTQVLRELEASGLVQRTVYPVVPPMVEYRLTPLGETLMPLLRAVKDWSEQHMDDVLEARAAYARRSPPPSG